jgi:ubiquinone/menaquinone biosynthesis C-methylase UbiE
VGGVRPHLGRRFWSWHARSWDRVYAGPRYDERAAWLAGAVGAPARALDVGCGTGELALALAARGLQVVGVDYAPGMLARAAEKASRDVAFWECDVAHGLPVPDAAFDAAACSYVLQVIPDPVRLLAEMRRVMRPGAVAVVEVPVRRSLGRELARGGAVPLVKALLSRLPGAVRWYTPESLRAQAPAAGLEAVEERTFERSCAALVRRVASRGV